MCLTNQIYSVLLNAFEFKEITEVQNAHLKILLQDGETRTRRCKTFKCSEMRLDNLECLIKKPTRGTKTSQTLLDVMMTNKPELFRTANVYEPGISDHAMVYGIMRERAIHHSSRVITVRSHKSIDEAMLLQDISFAPWHVGEIFDSIDDQYFYWSALLNDVLQEHIPLRKKRVRSKDVPYMTDQWKDAVRKKRKYSKMFATFLHFLFNCRFSSVGFFDWKSKTRDESQPKRVL